jgi:Luciferase-like monooxygenase
MRIGMFLAYWPWFSFEEQVKLSRLGDEVGLDSVWISEAWGHDAVSVLGYLAAKTERIALGSALMQIPARQPTATAMAAVGLDVVSGGRFRLGLGLSGPQVSEGWYGVPFDSPIGRTREYVEIVRAALKREPVVHDASTGRFPFRPIRGSDLASRCGCSQPRSSSGYRSTSERSGRKPSGRPGRSLTAGCRSCLTRRSLRCCSSTYATVSTEVVAASPIWTSRRARQHALPTRSTRRATLAGRSCPSTSVGWVRQRRTSTSSSPSNMATDPQRTRYTAAG